MRIDTAQRLVHGSVEAVFAAFADPSAWIEWLPPTGMTGRIETFEFRNGGVFRLILTYSDPIEVGKAGGNEDVVEGHFADLIPDQQMVQLVTFPSHDPAFAGTMRMTWTLTPDPQGALVTITAEDVPQGISAADHKTGMESTLANLDRFVSKSANTANLDVLK